MRYTCYNYLVYVYVVMCLSCSLNSPLLLPPSLLSSLPPSLWLNTSKYTIPLLGCCKGIYGTSCSCTLRCGDKVSVEERKKLFEGNCRLQYSKLLPLWIGNCSTKAKVHNVSKYFCEYSKVFYLNKDGSSVWVCKVFSLSMQGFAQHMPFQMDGYIEYYEHK